MTEPTTERNGAAERLLARISAATQGDNAAYSEARNLLDAALVREREAAARAAGRHDWPCALPLPHDGPCVPARAAGIDAETLARALDRVWAMGWITMPQHETEEIAQAILDALAAEKERP